eukprot:g19379.t1
MCKEFRKSFQLHVNTVSLCVLETVVPVPRMTSSAASTSSSAQATGFAHIQLDLKDLNRQAGLDEESDTDEQQCDSAGGGSDSAAGVRFASYKNSCNWCVLPSKPRASDYASCAYCQTSVYCSASCREQAGDLDSSICPLHSHDKPDAVRGRHDPKTAMETASEATRRHKRNYLNRRRGAPADPPSLDTNPNATPLFFQNPFDIARDQLLSCSERLRRRLLTGSAPAFHVFAQLGNSLAPSAAPSHPAKRRRSNQLKLRPRCGEQLDQDLQHTVSAAEMGNYLAVLRAKQPLRDSMSEDEASVFKINFGSRYRTNKALGGGAGIVADELGSGTGPAGVKQNKAARRKKKKKPRPPSFALFINAKKQGIKPIAAGTSARATDTLSLQSSIKLPSPLLSVDFASGSSPQAPDKDSCPPLPAGEAGRQPTHPGWCPVRRWFWQHNGLNAFQSDFLAALRAPKHQLLEKLGTLLVTLRALEGPVQMKQELQALLMQEAREYGRRAVVQCIEAWQPCM